MLGEGEMLDLRGKIGKFEIDESSRRDSEGLCIFLVTELLKSVVYQSKLGDYTFIVTST